MIISSRILSLRIQKGLTQKDVGRTVGVSEVSVSCWENGTKKPSIAAVISLSKLYGVSTDYILGVDCCENNGAIPLSKDEVNLLSCYRLLDAHGKMVVGSVCNLEKSRIISGIKDGSE